MRIAIFSLGPIFPETVHGGSQKTLRDIAVHAGQAGHTCSIYCTRRADNNRVFQLAPNVTVFPVLEFKETYPEPYYTAPYKLRNIISVVREAVGNSDVFYIHDAELLYHFLYEDIPTTMAIQDFVYPDTLAGCLSFRRDQLIVSSPYVSSCVRSVFADFCAIEDARMFVVPNGFDSTLFAPTESQGLRRLLKLSPEDIPILYPHRPDVRKGIRQCLVSLNRVRDFVREEVFDRIRLLVPVWMDSEIMSGSIHEYQSAYADAQKLAVELGMPEILKFHGWIPTDRMPEYYSLGAATLCIGNFIEAFGNASVESELCGTPALVSRVGAQRTVLPDHLVRKVDYGDTEAVARMLSEIVLSKPPQNLDLREFVSAHYAIQDTAAKYVDAITSCTRSQPIADRRASLACASDELLLPPWCSLLGSGLYNDYEYGYSNDEALIALVQSIASAGSVNFGELEQRGVSFQSALEWVQEGWLIRRPKHVLRV